MKSFNQFLGKSAIFFSILLFLSIVVSVTYGISHPNLFNNLDFKAPDGSFNFAFTGRYLSEFSTITEMDTFTADTDINNIVINSSFEQIQFIEEDIDTIWVEYLREKPEANNYQTTYSITAQNDTLIINTTTTIRDLITDKNYAGYIKIHVPKNYHFTSLDLNSDVSEINSDSILKQVDNLYLTAALGNIDITIDAPKETLKVFNELGSSIVLINAPIETLDISTALGNLDLTIKNPINYMYLEAEIGNIDIDAKADISTSIINNQSGKVDMVTTGAIKDLTIQNDVGVINLTIPPIYEIYYETELTSVNIAPEFMLANDPNSAPIKIFSDLGAINVYSSNQNGGE